MVLMAGMLPGVECARRRRIRQGVAEASCGTRRSSLCLYAGGHDHAHLGGSSGRCSSKETRSEDIARAWTLDSNAREAKERLDQKLRSRRESASVKSRRQYSTPKETRATTSGGGGDGITNHSSFEEEAPTTCALQREVLTSKTIKGGGRRFIWSRLGRRPPAAAAAECAVCLEELRAGDVLVHLPCAHRFHWACAVPWVRAAARCPVCRAQVHLLASSDT